MRFLSRWWRRPPAPPPEPLPNPDRPAMLSPHGRVQVSLRATDYTDQDDLRPLLWTTVTSTLTGAPMGFRLVIPADQLPHAGARVQVWLELQLRPDPMGPDVGVPFDRQDRAGHWPASDPLAQLAGAMGWQPQPAAWLPPDPAGPDNWEAPLLTESCPACYPDRPAALRGPWAEVPPLEVENYAAWLTAGAQGGSVRVDGTPDHVAEAQDGAPDREEATHGRD